jgi:hypothetical protein
LIRIVLVPGTEIALVGGGHFRVQEQAAAVEQLILAAARGSIMEFAWVTDAETGERVGFNPDHVVMLRDLGA